MCRKAKLEVCLESVAWTMAFSVLMAWGVTSECGLDCGFQCDRERVAWIVWLLSVAWTVLPRVLLGVCGGDCGMDCVVWRVLF